MLHAVGRSQFVTHEISVTWHLCVMLSVILIKDRWHVIQSCLETGFLRWHSVAGSSFGADDLAGHRVSTAQATFSFSGGYRPFSETFVSALKHLHVARVSAASAGCLVFCSTAADFTRYRTVLLPHWTRDTFSRQPYGRKVPVCSTRSPFCAVSRM
jgi:hypothetical protein